MSLYALKAPSGDLIECTVSKTRSEVHSRAFEWMSLVEGNEWRERFWKRDRATRDHLRRRGYRVVRVTIDVWRERTGAKGREQDVSDELLVEMISALGCSLLVCQECRILEDQIAEIQRARAARKGEG